MSVSCKTMQQKIWPAALFVIVATVTVKILLKGTSLMWHCVFNLKSLIRSSYGDALHWPFTVHGKSNCHLWPSGGCNHFISPFPWQSQEFPFVLSTPLPQHLPAIYIILFSLAPVGWEERLGINNTSSLFEGGRVSWIKSTFYEQSRRHFWEVR